ncbi:hypothetical protein LXL04_023155 [Taraxacum kok-saghyz]
MKNGALHYVTLNAGDWDSFTRRQGIDDICDGIPSSIKKWKPEFIFVDAKEFSPNMVFGDHKNRAVDHPPELTPDQQVLIDQMVANPVKWSDPDELMLRMDGLSTYWNNLGKQPVFMVGGKVVTLLDRLQRRKFTGVTEVHEGPISDFLGPSVLDTALEEESSMDSANQTEGDHECTSDAAKAGRRVSKSDHSAGRPPSHPSRPSKETFVLKKRSPVPASGGSSSPDSEKGKSGSGEVKDISQSKRRRLVRGGRQPGKGIGVVDQRPTSPAVVAPVSKPDISPSSLYECPISVDVALEGATVAPDNSPVGPIFFSPSQLPTTASLTRTVDLSLPKATESSPVSGIAVVPPLALHGAGLCFGEFASAMFSSPDPITTTEKQADVPLSSPGIENVSSCQPEAILSVPSVPSSPEAVGDTVAPDSPSSVKVSLPGCSSSIPMLVSLVATLPAFQRPYIASSVGRVPGLGELSEEEGLDWARSLLLEGIHWANGVMLRQQTRASVLAAQQTECERLKKSMENAYADYMIMVEGKLKLVRELQQMELRNQELVMEIDSMKEKQNESIDVRQSIEKQLEDAHRHREIDLKKLEEVGLEILCNQKDVVLTRQGCEIEEQKTHLLRLEDQVRVLTAECSAAKQAGLFHQQMFEQHAEDLSWLLKHGVASSVRAILNSEEFGSLNAACQTACLEMKTKYPILEKEPLLYSYPHSQEEMLDQFSRMTGHEYQLLGMLREGSIGVEYLKKYLDDNEGEEVNVAGGGSIGITDFESVRADSVDSARLNVDDREDSKMSEGRAGGDGVVLDETDNTCLTGTTQKTGGKGVEDESMLNADDKDAEKMSELGDGKRSKIEDAVNVGASKIEGVDGGSGETGDTDEAGAKLDGADKRRSNHLNS